MLGTESTKFLETGHCSRLPSYNFSFFFQNLKPTSQLLPNLSHVLKFTRLQEVVFGLAFLYSSNPDIYNLALSFVKQKLIELIHSYITSGNVLILFLFKDFIVKLT